MSRFVAPISWLLCVLVAANGFAADDRKTEAEVYDCGTLALYTLLRL